MTSMETEQTHQVTLIDDDENLSALISLWLRRAGYQVNTHLNSESGLSSLSSQRCDVVCLDLELPDQHGFETLDAIIQNFVTCPLS